MRNLRLAGPSANPLMTADEYERNRRTESNALRASVERHYPAWTDAHIPRTEKPVRFAVLMYEGLGRKTFAIRDYADIPMTVERFSVWS